MAEPEMPAGPTPPPAPPQPPSLAPPYSPYPTHPPPPLPRGPRPGRTEGRSVAALLSGIIGLVLAIPLGVPGMILGPLAYFLGKSAVGRVDESRGELGGRSTAVAGWVIGAIATALGAIVTLVWFILLLVTVANQPTQ
jgi:hypothetical protein